MFVVVKPDMVRRTHAGDRRVQHEDLERRRRLVRRVQQLLREKGYEPGPTDGLWGPRTGAALTAFQLDNQLEPDGILGPNTLNKLFDDER